MKTLTAIVLMSVASVASSPVFAGRDETQIMQMRQAAAEVKKAEYLAQAKQGAGFAGAIGVRGKLGPGNQPRRSTRDPANHP